jgi:H+/gluconate symporter-like permease
MNLDIQTVFIVASCVAAVTGIVRIFWGRFAKAIQAAESADVVEDAEEHASQARSIVGIAFIAVPVLAIVATIVAMWALSHANPAGLDKPRMTPQAAKYFWPD